MVVKELSAGILAEIRSRNNADLKHNSFGLKRNQVGIFAIFR